MVLGLIMVNSESSHYKRERTKGLVALWFSMIIPVIYVAKNFDLVFDITTLSLRSEYENGTKAFIEKFEPLLHGPYIDVGAITELCVTILALIAVYWKPSAVLLLPYVICTSAWGASVAIYLLFFVICKKPHPVNAVLIFTCITIYSIVLLHAYFASLVFKLCTALNQEHRASISSATNKANRSDLVEIPLPISRVNLPPKYGRKPCPSVIYSDLLRKYEPYFPDVKEPDEQIIYRRD